MELFRLGMVNISKKLIPSSEAAMKKVTTFIPIRFFNQTWYSLTCIECMHLSRFGYNSEKQFNNPLFLKTLQRRER